MPHSATSLKLDPAIKERVRQLALAQRRTPHWILREAVAQYVEREERRGQLQRQAEAAWAQYQQTGLHATALEVDLWLERLEAGEDAPPPPCHT